MSKDLAVESDRKFDHVLSLSGRDGHESASLWTRTHLRTHAFLKVEERQFWKRGIKSRLPGSETLSNWNFPSGSSLHNFLISLSPADRSCMRRLGLRRIGIESFLSVRHQKCPRRTRPEGLVLLGGSCLCCGGLHLEQVGELARAAEGRH